MDLLYKKKFEICVYRFLHSNPTAVTLTWWMMIDQMKRKKENKNILGMNTVKPRPEAHMDMILFEVFLKSIDLIPQQHILQRRYLYYR